MITDTIDRISNILNEPDYIYEDTETQIKYDIGDAYANIVILIGVIGYTIIFAVKYLKREFTIIFLILLAPISCITYPIDKISDGKAQAYNKWFQEFLYEVIIQPFHLLIYIVLVGTASELANTNLFYALVCFAVMIPAEQFIKSMFGFRDQLSSPLGAFGAGAIASQIFNKAKSAASGIARRSSSGDNDSGGDNIDDSDVKTKDPVLPGSSGDKDNTDNEDDGPRTIADGNDDAGDGDGGSRTLTDGNDAGDDPGDDVPPITDNNANGDDTPPIDDDNANSDDTPLIDDDNADDKGTLPITDDSIDDTTTTSRSDAEEKYNSVRDGAKKIKTKALENKALNALYKKHNYKVMNKYGTLKPRELAKKRLWRGAKKSGKFVGRTIKKGVTLTGAFTGGLVLGGLGFMFGKGKEAAMIGAGGGTYLAKKVNSAADKVASKIGEQVGIAYGGIRGEDKDRVEYKKKAANIKKAQAIIKAREKRNATAAELDNELNKMHEMAQRGVKPSYIAGAMELYNDLKDDPNNELDDITSLETAIYAATEAQEFDRKDFTNPEIMQKEHENLLKAYANAGVSENIAKEHADRILLSAGGLKGVNNVAIPASNDQTVDIPVSINRKVGQTLIHNYDAVEDAPETKETIERMNNITYRLQENGYTEYEIERIAQLSYEPGVSVTEIIEKYAANVEYVTVDNKVTEVARNTIERVIGKKATEVQIKQEKIERLNVSQTFNIDKEEKISKIREREIEIDQSTATVEEKTQVEMAREFAIANRERLKNSYEGLKAEGSKVRQQLINKIVKGGSSKAKAIKDADNIIELSHMYVEGKDI